ncbi:DUF2155 domain-containing protein [Acetobacter nitrogenifigens]|uniref:DUF2155 domain-containing protein n=1 Tax=Acetobacter nitrogenifigens TaxID=285268 RepID=UPI000405CEC7|nr:DUF2155 domain-containing protein [Acetobacter nitrogenifigens]
MTLRIASRRDRLLAHALHAIFVSASLAGAGVLGGQSRAAQPLAPPAMYPADTWQGKSVAVVRVLNRLDAHVETLNVTVGALAHYESLDIGVARCLDRPATLPSDAAAWLDVQDQHTQKVAFHGWMLAKEPSLGIFESPVYDVRVVKCDGADVAPSPGPLVQPPVPTLPGAPPAATTDGTPQTLSAPSPGQEPADSLPSTVAPLPAAPQQGAPSGDAQTPQP